MLFILQRKKGGKILNLNFDHGIIKYSSVRQNVGRIDRTFFFSYLISKASYTRPNVILGRENFYLNLLSCNKWKGKKMLKSRTQKNFENLRDKSQ